MGMETPGQPDIEVLRNTIVEKIKREGLSHEVKLSLEEWKLMKLALTDEERLRRDPHDLLKEEIEYVDIFIEAGLINEAYDMLDELHMSATGLKYEDLETEIEERKNRIIPNKPE